MSLTSSIVGVESPACEPDNALVQHHRSSAGAARRISRLAPEQLTEVTLEPISVGLGRDALDPSTVAENRDDGSRN